MVLSSLGCLRKMMLVDTSLLFAVSNVGLDCKVTAHFHPPSRESLARACGFVVSHVCVSVRASGPCAPCARKMFGDQEQRRSMHEQQGARNELACKVKAKKALRRLQARLLEAY